MRDSSQSRRHSLRRSELLLLLFAVLAAAVTMLNPDLFGWVCHQLPERSLHPKGNPLLLCARCTGFFVSIAIVLGCGALFATRGYRRPHRRLNTLYFLMVTANAVDGLISFIASQGAIGPYTQSNELRLLLGALCGSALGALFLSKLHPPTLSDLSNLSSRGTTTLPFALLAVSLTITSSLLVPLPDPIDAFAALGVILLVTRLCELSLKTTMPWRASRANAMLAPAK